MSFYSEVKFNNTLFTTIPNFTIYEVDHDTPPEERINIAELARKHGGKLYYRQKAPRRITITGYINTTSRSSYLSSRDALLKLLENEEATLEIPTENDFRTYTATAQSTMFSDKGGGYASVIITFICADPFGYEKNARTIINGTTKTASPSTFSLSEAIGGTYETPPYITLTLIAVSGGTGKYIDLSNPAGDNIRITRNWVADDVLTIDMLNKTCKVNGSSVDFTGTFWDFSIGDNALTYSDNFTTSRKVGVIMTYRKRY